MMIKVRITPHEADVETCEKFNVPIPDSKPQLDGEFLLMGFSTLNLEPVAIVLPMESVPANNAFEICDLTTHKVTPLKGSAELQCQDIPVGSMPLSDYVNIREKEYIRGVLSQSGDNKELAASTLGISIATLYRKLEGEG